MDESRVMDIQDQYHAANVPFSFKHWGGVHKYKNDPPISE